MVKPKGQKINFRKRKSLPKEKRPVNVMGFLKFFFILFIVGIIGVALASFQYMFVDSEYFLIKEGTIKLHDGSGFLKDLSIGEIDNKGVLGKNIFFVDIQSLKNKIESLHPEFKDIAIRRLLPNKIIVKAILRKPAAQVRSDRYYLVDREGVFLNDVRNFPDPGLTIITGLIGNFAKKESLNFTQFEKEKLDKALAIINEMSSDNNLSAYKLRHIDVTDPGNISFVLDLSGLEIKIGKSGFNNRLKMLATVLGEIGDDIDEFRYIDLRFEDPIIGHK
ncbi:MAG: cell division protein FtsQ/DivIB [Candidatus Omnitrophota bacterium]